MSTSTELRRPLLVGEANPYSGDPSDALLPWPRGATGDRLARHLGLSHDAYLAAFDRCNLFARPPARWSASAARVAAVGVPGASDEEVPIIMLGRRVAAAFGPWNRGVVAAPWTRLGRLYAVPHPSGRSTVWNRPDAPEKLCALLREFLPPVSTPYGWQPGWRNP